MVDYGYLNKVTVLPPLRLTGNTLVNSTPPKKWTGIMSDYRITEWRIFRIFRIFRIKDISRFPIEWSTKQE